MNDISRLKSLVKNVTCTPNIKLSVEIFCSLKKDTTRVRTCADEKPPGDQFSKISLHGPN